MENLLNSYNAKKIMEFYEVLNSYALQGFSLCPM